MVILRGVESHVLRWSRSRFLRYDGVGVEIYKIKIILYVNCLKMNVNNLHQIAYIVSYDVCVSLILNLQQSKH